MQTTQITLRNIQRSTALHDRIRQLREHLERYHPNILTCRVSLEEIGKRHAQGKQFDVAVTVHIPYGFSSIKLQSVTAAGPQFGPPGYETDLLYLAALAALVMGGTGPFALDQLLERNRADPKNSGANTIEARFVEPAHRRQAGGWRLVAHAQRLRDHESNDATGRKIHGQSCRSRQIL
jgi:hypothetical protein